MSNRNLAAIRKHFRLLTIFAQVMAIFALCNSALGQAIAEALEEAAQPAKKTSASYQIGPGDVLEVIPVKLVPKSPYRFEVGDELNIKVIGTVPDAPIHGLYPINTDGTVNLSFSYQTIRVIGMTEVEAELALRTKLLGDLRDPLVKVSLGSVPDRRSVAGKHVVGTDGNLILGVFGSVPVANLSLEDARAAIEEKLSKTYESAELWVKLRESNSKFYHVILFQAGKGFRVTQVKHTGNTTVLDAVAALDDFLPIKKIRISRPSSKTQILHVEWEAIHSSNLDTNHKLQPGDVVTINAFKQ